MPPKSIPLSIYAHKKSGRVMEPPSEVPFSDFVARHEKLLHGTFQKGWSPGFMFGISKDGGRRTESFDSLQMLILDGDKIPIETLKLETIFKYLASLQAAYYYTERRTKDVRSFHIFVPFSEPVPMDRIKAVREKHRLAAEASLGVSLDRSMDYAHQICFSHTRRAEDEADGVLVSSHAEVEKPFLAPGTSDVRVRRAGTLTPDPAAPLVLRLIQQYDPTATRSGNRGREKWLFKCPHDHKEGATKTAYFPDKNRVTCFADQCMGKPLAYFFEAMPPAVANQWFTAHEAALQTLLPAPIPRVTLEEARSAITKELAAVRSNGTQWTVVRVTTGSGKTHSAIQLFEAESLAATEETTPAILATYSNKIVYEIDAGLKAAHRRVVGTLAVLGPDGRPACQRFEEAKPLQDAGVDVVKALCLKCPYREGCPAHSGREVGTGHVTVTNHALVPPVLKKLGGYPRLILDETPPVVEETVLTREALGKLIAQLKRDAQPGDLWGTDGRVFKREVAEAVAEMLPWLERLPLGRERADAEWARLHATRLGALTLRETPQKHLAGILGRLAEHGCYACDEPLWHREVMGTFEALGKLMEGTLERGEDDSMISVRVGETASEWALRGGLILDATAAVEELRVLVVGGDVRVADLCVEDAGEARREMWYTRELGRRVVEQSKQIPAWVLLKLDSLEGTVMLFCYRSMKAELQARYPQHAVRHYGETRGSNEAWEGTDVFVTVGDPLMNLDAFERRTRALGGKAGDPETLAAAELAQCHGRARSPLNTRNVRHLHFGNVVPYGWDSGNCFIRGAQR